MIAYVLMAALSVLAMLVLTRPWWGRAHAGGVTRRAVNVAAYRTRLAEIDADLSAGLADTGTADALKQELAARLLMETDEQKSAAPVGQGHSLHLAMGLAVILPAAAALWYFSGDTWQTQRNIESAAANPEQAQSLMIDAMVKRLEQRLAGSPEDAEGWAMLGRSYFVMERYTAAAEAYAKASALNGRQNADWLAGEGEALAMAHQRELAGEPAARFEEALKLDPDQGKALWYAGLVAAEAGDYARAQRHWLRLRGQELPPELAQALEIRLQELSRLSGLPLPPRTTGAITAGDAGAADKAAAQPPVRLQVRVSLAPALTAQVPAGATLFVFAKAAAGPPMPLAVQKLPGTHLPLEVTLDDSMAMMPQLRLSRFDRWLVTARLSAAGGVQPQSGDLQGQVTVERSGADRPLAVVIDTVVP